MPPRDSARIVAQRVCGRLESAGLTIAVAEAPTGGQIGQHLVQRSGASAYFLGAIVAYSYASLTDVVGVPSDVIERYGAVSAPCVTVMAQRIRRLFSADLGLAVAGIAGPTGGTAAKPVGLLWVAIADAQGTRAGASHLPSASRLRTQAGFTHRALVHLLRYLQQVDDAPGTRRRPDGPP